MIPYAYKDHQLFEHLEGTADKAIRYVDSLGHNVICNRFRKLELSINNEELKEVVRLSALLHDIGKAADKYQRGNLESFNLHEIPSAVIAKRVLEEKIAEEHIDLIVITVLQHMNSMRNWMNGLNTLYDRYEWTFTQCINEVQSFFHKHGLRDDIDWRVTANNAKELIHSYQDKSRSKGWLKLYNLILALITAGDNIDAYKARKNTLSPQRRWFIEELIRLEEY